MAKVAEKLFILRQHSEALLQRLYTIKNSLIDPELKPDIMKSNLNVDMKKLFAKLSKDAPHIVIDELEKIQGFDWVLNNMTTLFNQVHPIYTTFKEVLQWTEHAQQTINEMATNANIEFLQDVNFLTCYDYMQMLVGYVKLILLLNRIKEKELIVCLLNLSYLKLNGTSEPNIQRVWQLFKDFQDPIPRFQEKWFTIQDQVGKAMIGLIPAFERGTFAALNTKRPLEMLSEPDRIPFPAVEETYLYLTSYQDIVEWISIIYSCCPDALTRTPDKLLKVTTLPTNNSGRKKDAPPRCYEILLQRVLVNNLVIPLYGDEVYDIHEPFKEYVMIKKFGDLKKEKKSLKEISEMAAERCHEYHKELRNYLRLQLKSLLNMMKDQPGLLGPKFNLVLAAITMAKSEIMWYFNHNDYIPKIASKKLKQVKETHISEMIYLMDEMMYVCVQHRDVIRKYSLKIMRGLYHNKVRQLVEETRTRLEQAKVTHVMESILNDIQNTEDFEALRLNWRRVESFLSGYQFKQSLGEFQNLFTTMTKVFTFSKHVDGLYDELVERGSLKQLYFYKNHVDKIFQDGLTAKKTQPLYSTAFIRTLNTYADNIHPQLNANLRNKIGEQSVQMGEEMLKQLVERIKKSLDSLNGLEYGYRKLTNQISAGVAVNTILRRYGKNKQYIEEPVVPGIESHFENNALDDMRDMELNVTQLLYSLGRYNEIVVYDTVFYPVEYLRTVLEEYISEYIKKISAIELTQKEMKNDALPPKFITPTALLSELHSFMSLLKIVEQCVNINTEELVLNAYLEHFVHLNYVESPFGVNQTTEPANAIITYSQWFTELVCDPQKYKTIFHPNRQTFISTPATPIQNYNVEQYLDYNELDAFTTLTGPYGYRALNQSLLDEVYTRSEKVREVLSQTNNVLKEIEGKLYDDKFVLDKKLRTQLQALEPLMGLMIQLGGILEFRQCLQSSLQTSVRKNAPAIYDVVDSAYEQYARNYYGDGKFMPVDGLATDCGFSDVDHALRLKIASLVDRSQVWEVLPLAFSALIILHTLWKEKDSVYDVNIEGWLNNTHLSITAFHRLIQAVHSVKSNKIADLEKDYKRFAEFSAMILLHMKGTKGYEKQLDTCTIFIDRTVKTSKYLDMSFFEDLLPYPLIRTTYVKIFEPHQFEEVTTEATSTQPAGTGTAPNAAGTNPPAETEVH